MTGFDDGMMFDSFGMFPTFVGGFFVVIVLVILGMIIYKLSETMRNASAPEEVFRATLIDKLADRRVSNHDDHMSSSSTYTLTFELENNERKSFDVSRKEYLKYVVGDTGRLSFQRKKFNGFQM